MFGKQQENIKAAKAAEWLDLKTMAAVFAMTPQGFSKVVRPIIPAAAVKDPGERGAVRIHCRSAIDAFLAKQLAQAEAKRDPLLSGNDSPELERYRRARADLAEMERDRTKGNLVARDELDPAMGHIASTLRQAVATLQRQHGNEASAVISEALDEVMKRFEAAPEGSAGK